MEEVYFDNNNRFIHLFWCYEHIQLYIIKYILYTDKGSRKYFPYL